MSNQERFELFFKADLEKNQIKWWQRIFLFVLPTYEVLEGDSAHYFKHWRGHVYYIGERVQ